MNSNMYSYACDASKALKEQVARNSATKTPDQAAEQLATRRRIALTAGRPVPPRQLPKD